MINFRSLKGHCDTMTFEMAMSNPRKQDVGEPLEGTSVVVVDV